VLAGFLSFLNLVGEKLEKSYRPEQRKKPTLPKPNHCIGHGAMSAGYMV